VDGDRRIPVARSLVGTGGGGGGGGPYSDEGRRQSSRSEGPSEDRLSVSLKIPAEEAERRRYTEQFLDALAREPGATPEEISRTRLLLGDPNIRGFLDGYMPNRPGVYEIECRYRSRDPRFWPEALVAPSLRVEFVKRQEWIDALTRRPRLP
jgi:hypothetical protein